MNGCKKDVLIEEIGDRKVFIFQCSMDEFGYGIGYFLKDGTQSSRYLFNENTRTAVLIPEKYQNTPICVVPFCGGCSEGLVMVSELGEIELQYHHNKHGCAGLWGWLDEKMNVVIQPKYVYAMNFKNGRAVVCKGEWSVKKENGECLYWCENEQWGIIDRNENEIVPCRFDELCEIENTDRFFFVHEGGWERGKDAIYDAVAGEIILTLDFDFDMGYMFNECFLLDDRILVFDNHLPGKEKDLVYAYDLIEKKWIVYGDELGGRTLDGKTRCVVDKDGREIILF